MNKKKLTKTDRENIRSLYHAVGEYHRAHCDGPGVAVCICGTLYESNPPKACKGLALLRDLFQNENMSDPEWRKQFKFIKECFIAPDPRTWI